MKIKKVDVINPKLDAFEDLTTIWIHNIGRDNGKIYLEIQLVI